MRLIAAALVAVAIVLAAIALSAVYLLIYLSLAGGIDSAARYMLATIEGMMR